MCLFHQYHARSCRTLVSSLALLTRSRFSGFDLKLSPRLSASFFNHGTVRWSYGEAIFASRAWPPSESSEREWGWRRGLRRNDTRWLSSIYRCRVRAGRIVWKTAPVEPLSTLLKQRRMRGSKGKDASRSVRLRWQRSWRDTFSQLRTGCPRWSRWSTRARKVGLGLDRTTEKKNRRDRHASRSISRDAKTAVASTSDEVKRIHPTHACAFSALWKYGVKERPGSRLWLREPGSRYCEPLNATSSQYPERQWKSRRSFRMWVLTFGEDYHWRQAWLEDGLKKKLTASTPAWGSRTQGWPFCRMTTRCGKVGRDLLSISAGVQWPLHGTELCLCFAVKEEDLKRLKSMSKRYGPNGAMNKTAFGRDVLTDGVPVKLAEVGVWCC